jgi:ankyrin repeat protein
MSLRLPEITTDEFYEEEFEKIISDNEEEDDPALHKAAWYCNYEEIKSLLQYVDVNAINKDGETALHKAAWQSDTEIINLLLNHGANANAKNKDGLSVLHRASRTENFEVLNLLIKNGADVNAKYHGETLLHKSVWYGQIKLVTWLLKHGIDYNCRDNFGRTALHYANRSSNFEIYKILLHNGADSNVIDMEGTSAKVNETIEVFCKRIKKNDFNEYKIAEKLRYSDIFSSAVSVLF